jgi:fido (protein-threonine AMPylation protein)
MNAASDPYLYPGTDVLRNVPGLRNAEQLAAFETAKTAQRIYELQKTPVVSWQASLASSAPHPQRPEFGTASSADLARDLA